MKKIFVIFTVLVVMLVSSFGYIFKNIPANVDYAFVMNGASLSAFVPKDQMPIDLSTFTITVGGKYSFEGYFDLLINIVNQELSEEDMDEEAIKNLVVDAVFSIPLIVNTSSPLIDLFFPSLLKQISENVKKETITMNGVSVDKYILDIDGKAYNLYTFKNAGNTVYSNSKMLADASTLASKGKYKFLESPVTTVKLDKDVVYYGVSPYVPYMGSMMHMLGLNLGKEKDEELFIKIKDNKLEVSSKYKRTLDTYEKGLLAAKTSKKVQILKNRDLFISGNKTAFDLAYILNDALSEDLKEIAEYADENIVLTSTLDEETGENVEALMSFDISKSAVEEMVKGLEEYFEAEAVESKTAFTIKSEELDITIPKNGGTVTVKTIEISKNIETIDLKTSVVMLYQKEAYDFNIVEAIDGSVTLNGTVYFDYISELVDKFSTMFENTAEENYEDGELEYEDLDEEETEEATEQIITEPVKTTSESTTNVVTEPVKPTSESTPATNTGK